MHLTTTDDTDSLIRCAKIVAAWLLALALLPPSGLFWQFGIYETCGNWLVNGLLAAFDLSGLVQ